jgi:hypothetical protein
MGDMSAVIIPKSDQINADDLIAGPKTYTIEAVEVRPGTEQPVNIHLVGEDRAWRPCKSMSRVLVAAWGPDSAKYKGKSLTLYRDPKVKWGGLEVGGIRISHMSHLDREMLMQLTATKGKRAPHIVKPLVDAPPPQTDDRAAKWAASFIAGLARIEDDAALTALLEQQETRLAELANKRPELRAQIDTAIEARRGEFNAFDTAGTTADPFADDQPALTEN